MRETIRGSLWVIPLVGALLGGLLGVLVSVLDEHLTMPAFWQYSPSTASTLLTAIVGASAALTGFVVTVTVLVVQMATGTFSARYMRLWYRDRMLKATLAVLIGTLTFSFALLRRIEATFVPELGVTIAGTLIITSLLVFIFFFDRFIHRLRPVTVDALVRWAREHDSTVVLTRVVGDFVPTGTTLMQVYGPVRDSEEAERELRGLVALGEERTIQQDPALAIRIMADIALMALSPAVNAPTTAVQVLDYLGETLRLIGSTNLEKRTRPMEPETPGAVV